MGKTKRSALVEAMRRASERVEAESPSPSDGHLALARRYVELMRYRERALEALRAFVGMDADAWERFSRAADVDGLLAGVLEEYVRKICECTTIEDARALVAYAEDPLFQRVRDLDGLFFQEQKTFSESWFTERAEAIEKALGGG